MDIAFAEASIADLTRSCLEGARQSIQQLKGKDKIYMQTRLADLRLWADSVGATAPAKASLDQRFQHRPEDIYLIRGLLFMLQGFFNECSIAVDNQSDIEDIISNIDSTVDSLGILGVQIRRSGRQSRLRKADSSFDKNREKYHKLRVHLACIIASKPTKNGRPATEGAEIHSVDYFANLKLAPIQERLIEANLRRRHRFLEAQRHSHGLKDTSTKAYQLIIPRQTTAESTPSHTKQGVNSTPARQTLPPNPRHNSPMTTVTSTSGMDSKWGGLRDSRRPGSTVTRITNITAAARYPKAHASWEQKLIKCPCCCQAIPASEMEGTQWRKHLANDISPYTCILENCPTPYKLFATHYEWKEHFMDDHPSQWSCPCCADAHMFKSLSGVINHIRSKHPDAISDRLDDLLSDAEIKVMGITKCPLCDSEGPQDSPDLVEHVLQHVHDFSLRSLPWPTDPPFHPSNPAATFNIDYATKVFKDDSGNEYSFSIAEWAESVAPKIRNTGEISVVDSAGDELFLDMAKYPKNMTPDSRPPLQLCYLDRNPPKISEGESTSVTQFNTDYFSGNPYFREESSDSWSSSQSYHPPNQRQDINEWKWSCTLCRSQSGQGDDEYFRHLEDTHDEIIEAAGENASIDIEEWKVSMLNEAYGNVMDAISITNSSSTSSNSRSTSLIQGEYEETEDRDQRTLELGKSMPGKKDSHTLTIMDSNALAFIRQKKYKEAEEIYRQMIELKESMLGRRHPDTLTSMDNLAFTFLSQKKYEEAEKLNRQIVELKESMLGKKHPDILDSIESLACSYSAQNKNEEAEKLFRQIIELKESMLGRRHLETLNSMDSLALALSCQEKYEEAEKLYRQLKELRESVQGRRHPNTLNTMDNFALALSCQDKDEEAEEIYRQIRKLKKER
ncbi:hypothetical protein F4825DRAFT_453287 [Nemania diffusa]|nr:hypothetical protein F4825DRAFT_453287 [Nemania diffusa]